ncbi:DUF732 domain-containing protein [Nocardia aurea]|uniref:DUF732 domain-containing protein n=1 Tax=Nocardia aurea TaxID=2144174 RepID=UPI0033A74792
MLHRAQATLLAIGTATVLLTCAPVAAAAPSTGSAGGSSSSGCGPRSGADTRFLRESYYDNEDCDLQDSAIGLAHASCDWLDTVGSTARNRIRLAERISDAVDYPYIFIDAAIQSYCPHNRR